ncbi:hypothetical protein SEUCBS139899_003206 [Sporothrix eucalyptigena]|uniref:Uncharacterized protein n=1 Tax=Sporothrix eucalyptigena TaxID=1812306 RepID=A0ABP0CGZ0_9PEZI
MPRFSFPVPGRRHKQESAAVLSPPLNKVQKLLGSSQINVDSTISTTADAPRHWDTSSNANSAISINISDSAQSYDDESQVGALPSLTEGEVVGGPRIGRMDGFEEESGVLPRAFADGDTNGDPYGHDSHSITDASSLRRKQSGSTIISYYDKTKVPLGISQQTSSSAMAKGLPTKASSLLDIDGSISQASRKKKPAKLDLSRMFANRKSSSTMTLNADRGLVLGPDMVTRSPSFMSVSPLEYLTRPHSGHRSERRLRPTTRGSNREELSGSMSPKQKLSNANQRHAATSQEATGLQNLYEHYEQMTFRNVFAEQDESASDGATPGESEDDNARPLSPMAVPRLYQEALDDAVTDTEQYPPQGIRELPLYKDISAYLGGYANASAIPHIETSNVPTLQAPVDDCSDSISSRHTRTSKASKRTAQSLLEIDLQQTSVLSLSSDSEDDFVDSRPKTSSTSALPSPRSQPDIRMSSQEAFRPTTSRSLSSGKRNKDRGSTRSDATVQFLPVPGSHDSSSTLLPATAYSRTSSASASTNSTTKPSIRDARSLSRESRVSVASNRTSVSPANYSVHEARAITLIPAQGASYTSSMHNHTTSSDQLTPPLSPSSMDFMMRSNHTSIYEGDQGSIRSAAGSFSGEPSRSPSAGQGRFMAVTRQEELLLAALRKKRLRMRESIIAEFEEEQEKEKAMDQDNASHQLPRPVHEIRRTSIDAVLELHSPQPRSMSRASVSFNDFPMHFEDSPFPVPPSAGIRNSLRSSSAMSMPLSPRSKPPTAQLPPTPVTKATTANADLDRVLMNMSNASAGKASSSGSGTGSGSGSTPASNRSEDIFGGVERSPRLSDCLDFDDGGSGSIESYDSFNFETPADQSPIDPSGASQQRSRYKKTSVKSREQHGSSVRLDHHRFPKSASRQSLPTVHDSDTDDDGMDADEDDDYSIHDDVEPAGMPYGDFVGTKGSHNSNNSNNSNADDDEQGIPRPDSPLEAPMHFHKKSAVRISAVGGGMGNVPMAPGWWGHND